MIPDAPNSVSTLLQTEHSALQRIFAKAKHLKQLNDVLSQCLPPNLKQHCVVANIYPEKLVILAENSAVLTQLRFAVPELIPQLKPKHPLLRELKQIECKVTISKS